VGEALLNGAVLLSMPSFLNLILRYIVSIAATEMVQHRLLVEFESLVSRVVHDNFEQL